MTSLQWRSLSGHPTEEQKQDSAIMEGRGGERAVLASAELSLSTSTQAAAAVWDWERSVLNLE